LHPSAKITKITDQPYPVTRRPEKIGYSLDMDTQPETQSVDLQGPLLGPDDPPTFEILNPDGRAQVLLICDHASRVVPQALDHLGLPHHEFERHIAYDIGAASVTRLLSQTLDATAVLAGFSRLVIDLNRPPGHPQSIPPVSDGTLVPANQNLPEAELDLRVRTFFDPYHEAVGHRMAHLWSRGPAPVLFSVHSFTPHFGTEARPWDVGILWKHDPRLAVPLMEKLAARGLMVGDNEPYSGLDIAYSIDAHAGAAGLASCVIEIRQDLVGDQAGIERWAQILTEDLGETLKNTDLYESRDY